MTIHDVLARLQHGPIPCQDVPEVLRATMLGRGLIGELQGYLYSYDKSYIRRTVRNTRRKHHFGLY